MRIAVIGSGISGLTAAHRLHPEHEVTVFEAESRVGGHANTVRVDLPEGSWDVDTGFIVLNDRNYPGFTDILESLGVATQPTHMGFSVSAEAEDFEYAGTPRGLVCQPSNLVKPAFLRMVADLLRFNREARALLGQDGARATVEGPSLGAFVEDAGYSRWFIDRLIVPQASAVWSADPAQMWSFPAAFLAEFFANHGMLGFRDRPAWRTVAGGSRRYVEALSAPFADRIRTSAPVLAVTRHPDRVEVTAEGAAAEAFDEVVLACHADEALAMLGADATPAEREILGALPFQRNEAVLHTDSSLLPKRAAARQAWNFHLLAEPRPLTTVTYWMNHLQRLDAPVDLNVTLNLTDKIDPEKILARFDYAHPVFTREGVAAQARHGEISGTDRTHYCGAYWRWGFHEDGVASADAALALRTPRAVAA